MLLRIQLAIATKASRKGRVGKYFEMKIAKEEAKDRKELAESARPVVSNRINPTSTRECGTLLCSTNGSATTEDTYTHAEWTNATGSRW